MTTSESIFDLKESAQQLPSLNQGTSKLTYEQVQPLRDVTGGSFAGGEINFRWEVAATKWWIPARSYMRMKYTLTAAGAQPTQLQDVAPNMGLMANLFQSAELRIADKTASRIDSYFAQVDAIEKRSNKSKAWLDSAGKVELWQPDMEERRAEVSSDGIISYDYNKVGYTELAAQVGFDAANNEVAFTTATNTLTWTINGGVAIDIYHTAVISVGDIITGVGGNFASYLFRVTSVPTLATAVVVRLAGAAANIAAETVVSTQYNRVLSGSSSLRKSGSVDIVWTPPLSIFKIQTALPAMKAQLTFQPQDVNSYKLRAIESLLGNVTQGVGAGQFDFVVDELHLYIATVNGPRVDNITYYLSLDETRCQPQNVTNVISLQQKNWDISPSSYAVSVSFQDSSAGVDTRRSASKFKIQPTRQAAPALPNFPLGQELAIDRLFILYAGQNKPSPEGDWKFDGTQDTYKQAYEETYRYNGGFYDAGGPESFRDWIDRGLYLYYSWPRDGNDRSTRIAVNFKFSEAPIELVGAVPVVNTGTVLLFDHYKRILIIQVVDGRVVDMIEQDS